MADDEHDYRPATGRLTRFAKLATLGAKLSTEVAGKGLKKLRGQEVEGILGAKGAEKLVATLGDMKGLAMKLGQAMSMDPDLFSPEVRAVVSRLQNQAPPMPFATVRKVIEADLGGTLADHYSSFEQKPLASASLGQVHAAVTRRGEQVAVKVQYPGIDDALQSDLENLGGMVKVVARSVGVGDMRAHWDELRDELVKELDYYAEAERAQRFAEAAAGLPMLRVPKVMKSLSAEHVLTMEKLEGPTLKELLNQGDAVPNDERLRVSGLLVAALWGPFLQDRVIHSDPHPGNFIVMPDGRLGVLDFGSIKEVGKAFHDANERIYAWVLGGPKLDLWKLTEAAGFTITAPREQAEPFIEATVALATTPAREAHFDFGKTPLSRELRNHFLKHALLMPKVRPPPEAVMFYRALGGLVQNLQALKASGNFRALYESLLPKKKAKG